MEGSNDGWGRMQRAMWLFLGRTRLPFCRAHGTEAELIISRFLGTSLWAIAQTQSKIFVIIQGSRCLRAETSQYRRKKQAQVRPVSWLYCVRVFSSFLGMESLGLSSMV